MKILLSERNADKLKEKIQSMRTSNCSVNSSKLANIVLDIFLDKYFEKHEAYIRKLLFDRKKYMRNLLRRDLTDEELQKELKTLTKATTMIESVLADLDKELDTRTVAKDSDE